MNRDLLEALSTVATDLYLDAMKRHPGLFTMTGVVEVTDEDRAMMPVLATVDELVFEIARVLGKKPAECPPD